MTAEVVVLNKNGVAIAADSAVTVAGTRSRTKVYNTVNKLFNLAPDIPVAVMIYGNAEFARVPWETIVKTFRAKFHCEGLPNLADYANNFIKYVDSVEYEQDDEETDAYTIISGAFEQIKKKIMECILSDAQTSQEFLEDKTKLIRRIESIISESAAHIEEGFEKIASIGDIGFLDYVKRFRRVIWGARQSVFGPLLPLSQNAKKSLYVIAWKVAMRTFSSAASGVVVAGFGKDDFFPGVIAYMLDGKISGRLKIKETKSFAVTKNNRAAIIPFAQHEMVVQFMEGVDKGYQEHIEGIFDKLLFGIMDLLCEKYLGGAADKETIIRQMRELCQDGFREAVENLSSYRDRNFIKPTIEAVEILPKEELAVLAEALVKLTSLKRKMSLDLETVGEPVDVAVISKGDGFVWIRRKHYFDISLNPAFSSRYIRRVGS